MLLDKLEQANRESRRARRRLAGGIAALSVLAALFLLDVLTFDLSHFGLSKDTSPAQPAATGEAAAPAPRPAAVPRAAQAPAQGPPPPANAAQAQEQRDAFKAELARFDAEILPAVSSDGFAAWSGERQRAILAGRDDASALFARADHAAALAALRTVRSAAEKDVAAHDDAFEKELSRARAYFEADDHEAASWRIAAALRLRPESPEARELKARIDRLPKILKLIEAARTARTENNLEAEARHLEELVAADPARKEAAARLATVRAEIKERGFAAHIRAGLEKVEARNLAAAEKQLKVAKALFPDRQEAAYLGARVSQLARDLKVESLISGARKAAKADDWKRAEALYIEVARIIPDKQEVIEGRRLARKIIDLDAAVAGHLAAPDRLSSLNVAKLAEELLTEVREVSAFSSTLQGKAKKLSRTLDDYMRKVSVRVVSDGETRVSVRGVGRIGPAEQKVIDLRPGRYVFEGERPGYKSKLVEVMIPPGGPLQTVEVICDEPL